MGVALRVWGRTFWLKTSTPVGHLLLGLGNQLPPPLALMGSASSRLAVFQASGRRLCFMEQKIAAMWRCLTRDICLLAAPVHAGNVKHEVIEHDLLSVTAQYTHAKSSTPLITVPHKPRHQSNSRQTISHIRTSYLITGWRVLSYSLWMGDDGAFSQ